MARLSQHFLTDQNALQDIVDACAVRRGDLVLEIGPGRGALTAPLLAAGAHVTAVELDDAFAERLAQVVPDAGSLTVINEDFLELDLASLPPGSWTVVGNLPYAVGTLILQKLLRWERWKTATLMFQKEVALRVASGTGGADYGLLALSTQLRADAEIVLELSPESFRPRPSVDSAVVRLRRLEVPRLAADDEKAFWRLAKIAFSQRRKMAAGVISKSLGVPRGEVEAAFAAAGVRPDARAETIPFAAWAALAKTLR